MVIEYEFGLILAYIAVMAEYLILSALIIGAIIAIDTVCGWLKR